MNERKNAAVAVTIFIATFALDAAAVFILKDLSSMCRWIWLPIISVVCTVACGIAIKVNTMSNLFFGWSTVLWAVIRGVLIVASYFNASEGFWAILGAVFLSLFMFIANTFSHFVCGFVIMSDKRDPIPNYDVPQRGFSESDPPNSEPREYYSPSYAPRQGNLADYFRAYACAPQGGTYFWYESPSMSSLYGSHSKYTITGTIGISRQSMETFNIRRYDMDHHLDSVVREVKSYFNEVVDNYLMDYPDDDTEFSVEIHLRITVV